MRFSHFEKWQNYDQIVSWYLLGISAWSSLAFIVFLTLYLQCLWKILELLYGWVPWLRHFYFKLEWISFLGCSPEICFCYLCLWRLLFYYVDNGLNKEQVYLVTFHKVPLKAAKPHPTEFLFKNLFQSCCFLFQIN